jgi:hypothetical protein
LILGELLKPGGLRLIFWCLPALLLEGVKKQDSKFRLNNQERTVGAAFAFRRKSHCIPLGTPGSSPAFPGFFITFLPARALQLF